MSADQHRGAQFMRALPLRPDFGVFGLGPSFTGARWLLLWQRTGGDHGAISEVSLGHGHPTDGAVVAVDTVHKPSRSDGTDLSFAALHAASGMIELDGSGYRPGRDRSRFDDELNRVAGGGFTGWDERQVEVDGVGRRARVRHLDRAWGLVVELPEVVISASGPAAVPIDGLALADVTARLGDYAAGVDERADSRFG